MPKIQYILLLTDERSELMQKTIRLLKIALFGAMISLIIACNTVPVLSSISTESTKDAAYNKLISGILVALDIGSVKIASFSSTDSPKVADYLQGSVQRVFNAAGLHTKVIQLSGAELDDNKTFEETTQFGTDTTMYIKVKEAIINKLLILKAGTFDISIYDVPSAKRIWRASIRVQPPDYLQMGVTKKYADQLVDEILAAMRRDYLLP
jgi:hypothetical protein